MKRIACMLMLVALLVPMLATDAGARDKMTMLTYQVGVPVGNVKDYTDEVSWLGFGIDFRTFRSRERNIAVGFTFAWQVFDQKIDNETIQIQNGAVTGTQRRYLNTLPFLLTAHWYTSQQSNVTRFYGGLGAGVYYTEQRFDIGVATLQENNWQFGLMGEGGVQIPFGDDMEILFGARYNYAFAGGKSIQGDGVDWDYVSVLAGIAWSRW